VLKRDFTRLLSVTAEEGAHLIARTGVLKQIARRGGDYRPLKDRCLAMIFEKASTRTRISFEVGMRQLGGYAIFMSPAESQIGRGEPIRDTARVLSRYADAIMLRTFSQNNVEELAQWATVPVINGLSDLYHPCQILADLFTVTEFKGPLQDLKIAYIGDGNNVANSWLEAALLLGFDFALAAPEGYEPAAPLLQEARKQGSILVTHDPGEAVRGADVVNTDVWVSMGQEKEKEARKAAFSGFRVDDDLLKTAGKDAIVMHCLPAYRNQEISEEVFERFAEIIFTQAENRLHAQKALLEWLLVTTGTGSR
jgi:ornithine carbamoyltransferase